MNRHWTRICPRCKSIVSYESKYLRDKYDKNKLTCNGCKSKKENLSKSTLLKRSKALKKVKHTWHHKIAKSRIKNGTYHVTEEVREKHRINKIENMIKDGTLIWPSFNRKACKIFKKLEKDLKLNGLYATKGKEKRIGRFWVDYYEPNINIVIEYDEKHHFDKGGNLKQKDLDRQSWIEKRIGCKFVRITSNTKYEQLKNIISGYCKKRNQNA